jgi:hypothetical protein
MLPPASQTIPAPHPEPDEKGNRTSQRRMAGHVCLSRNALAEQRSEDRNLDQLLRKLEKDLTAQLREV